MFCQEEVDLNCDSCYEITKEYCEAINIDPDISPGYESLYLQIIDKFIVRRTQLVDFNEDGSFDVDFSLLPYDFFNPYAGKFELYLSTDEEGEVVIPMSFDDEFYNCIILTLTKTNETECC
jgi:hypothetical protein